ncbi:MAG: hypothetical protein VX519_12385 [Myxococcota bacterium]|nr:hypothetical protein [Myxococcota bacterium]
MGPLVSGIEYHGRLARRDGRPAPPGSYDLRFALHSDQRIKRSCWSEEHGSVQVNPGGFFSVVLGLESPISPDYFNAGPRWASVCVVRRGAVEEETAPRVPVIGGIICLDRRTRRAIGRLDKLEEYCQELRTGPQAVELQTAIEGLVCRVEGLETGRVQELEALVKELQVRMKELDGEGRRVELLEERVDDIDGPHGELAEIAESLEAMEANPLSESEEPTRGSTEELNQRLARLEQTASEMGRRLETLFELLQDPTISEGSWEPAAASTVDLDIGAT